MIERLHRIATILSRVRPILILLAVTSAAVMLLSVIENPLISTYQWLIPAMSAMLWALTLFSLSYLFLNVPGQPDPSLNWRERLSRKIRRSALWVLGLVFVALSLALLVLTYQLLRVYFM